MTIGLPREIKPQESRIALLPSAAGVLIGAGHEVLVQSGAGAAAGFADDAFRQAGATIVDDAAAVYGGAGLIVKVKEPMEDELGLFQQGQTIFCYLHSETRPSLLEALLGSGVTAIAYENVRSEDGSLPLLIPMSIIAGQQAVLQGMQFLNNHRGGIGVSLVAYPGLPRARVIVLGAGHAGEQAARVAAALGAEVLLFDIDRDRLRALSTTMPGNVYLAQSGVVDLQRALPEACMVVHTTTIPTDSRQYLITRDIVKTMRPGSIIVDVTANLNGAIETVDRYTTHADPVYTVDGVLHYVVNNIPGTVARTASQALAMAVFPYVESMATQGIVAALTSSRALRTGLTCIGGQLTWKEAGERLGLDWITADQAVDGLSDRSDPPA